MLLESLNIPLIIMLKNIANVTVVSMMDFRHSSTNFYCLKERTLNHFLTTIHVNPCLAGNACLHKVHFSEIVF